MAKQADRAEKPKPVELPDSLIQSLVFETFGLRRFTQDSPIRPDVWVWFLKLARWRLSNPSKNTGIAKKYRLPLILTPKQTMSADGRPAGHAGQLAEKIRQIILGRRREMRGTTLEADKQRERDQADLGKFRIAATTRNVAIDVTFEEMMDYLLPLTAWWKKQTYSDKDLLEKDLEDHVDKGATVLSAMVSLDDTEFFRFAALSALTQGLLAEKVNHEDFDRFFDVLAPIHSAESELTSDERELFPERVKLGRDAPAARLKLEVLEPFWQTYRKLIEDKSRNLPSEDDERNAGVEGLSDEIAIWSIQLNRPTLKQAAPGKPPRVSGRANQSAITVKADAAKKLFGIKTSHLAWAVIDTGIDARHSVFLEAPKSADPDDNAAEAAVFDTSEPPAVPKSRVVATLDFTILQDLLAENTSQIDIIVDRITSNSTDLEKRGPVRMALLRSLKSIRDENITGRQLNWSLLEGLIRMDPLTAPVPSDPHGTHVAGILAGRELRNGVIGDSDPFEGVCPDVKIFDLRVFGNGDTARAEVKEGQEKRYGPTAVDGGDEFTVLAALDYVAWLNRDPMRPAIHGINLSLAIPFEVDSHACGRTPVCDACDRLVWNGTVVVAAAGNSGFDKEHKQAKLGVGYRGMTITDPGNAQEVITVGATHHSEPHTYGVSYFSSRGPTGDGRMKPDIVAPGEKIRSAIPGEKMLIMDGTSMAAPHVSGVCALLMGRYPELIGEPQRIKQILMNTATDLGRERHFQGAGLVDALRALQSV